MSAAVKESKEKQGSPLGSFLGKLQPVAKPAPAKETKDEPLPNGQPLADAGKPVAVVDAPVETPTKTPEPEAAAKTEEKPKEADAALDAKRLKDTQTWGNEEHKKRLAAEREAADLKTRLDRIEKKLDGTYEEPTAPSLEQATANADATGRIRASHNAAVRQYGKAFVMETVWNEDSPYMKLQAEDPRVKVRVMEADDPVLEAIAVVKEHQDGEKYGRTPEEIRKKMEAELVPKLKNDILEGLKTKPGPATNTLGSVRGDSERTQQKSDAPDRLDFKKVFPWGASRT